MYDKWLPAQNVCVILLPAETFNHAESLCRKTLQTVVLEGSKRLWTVCVEAKYDRQSWQEAKIGGLGHTYIFSYNCLTEALLMQRCNTCCSLTSEMPQ